MCGNLQPTTKWLNFPCADSLCLLQGERGLPGPSGPQGIQGCPGLRGLKVGLCVTCSLLMQMRFNVVIDVSLMYVGRDPEVSAATG